MMGTLFGSGRQIFLQVVFWTKTLTDRALRARVDKGLDRYTVHFDVDVQHVHLAEAGWAGGDVARKAEAEPRDKRTREGKGSRLGHRLHRLLHVLQHPFVPDRLFDLLLRFDVKGVGLEQRHLALALQPGRFLQRLELVEEFAEPTRVVLRRICQVGVRLSSERDREC